MFHVPCTCKRVCWLRQCLQESSFKVSLYSTLSSVLSTDHTSDRTSDRTSPGSGSVETAVIIGVVVAVAMVILLIIIITAFIMVYFCMKHKTTSESEKTTSESEKRAGEECVFPLISSCAQAQSDSVGCCINISSAMTGPFIVFSYLFALLP